MSALKALGDRDVSQLCIDSRRVQQGALFFALPGSQSDGNHYALSAVNAGAVGVVSSEEAPAGVQAPWIRVSDARIALAETARVFFARDSSPMRYAGITGTNGKTTLTYLLEAILQA